MCFPSKPLMDKAYKCWSETAEDGNVYFGNKRLFKEK